MVSATRAAGLWPLIEYVDGKATVALIRPPVAAIKLTRERVDGKFTGHSTLAAGAARLGRIRGHRVPGFLG